MLTRSEMLWPRRVKSLETIVSSSFNSLEIFWSNSILPFMSLLSFPGLFCNPERNFRVVSMVFWCAKRSFCRVSHERESLHVSWAMFSSWEMDSLGLRALFSWNTVRRIVEYIFGSKLTARPMCSEHCSMTVRHSERTQNQIWLDSLCMKIIAVASVSFWTLESSLTPQSVVSSGESQERNSSPSVLACNSLKRMRVRLCSNGVLEFQDFGQELDPSSFFAVGSAPSACCIRWILAMQVFLRTMHLSP